jgi:hypothetical protein
MTLVISKGITLRKGYIGTDDPDAEAYIAAIEAADEAESPGVGALETATKVAIHSFVKGCKNDGIWPAIKASCILAGARTLTGALVPLVGTAPTNNGPFVSGDYNRKTGLVGDGLGKYLDSNRAGNADPQNNHHVSVYATTAGSLPTGFPAYFGQAASVPGATNMSRTSNTATLNYASQAQTPGSNSSGAATGLLAVRRSQSVSFTARAAGANTSVVIASQVPNGASLSIFRVTGVGATFSNARLSFYSIGESLDLALLDARVTDLINAFGAAIP